MTDAKPSIADFENVLVNKERDLLLQRDEVMTFLDTDHKSADTKNYQIAVHKADKEITNIYRALIGDENMPSEFRAAARDLCQRCRNLHDYTTDMIQILGSDLTERKHAEEKNNVDVVKNVGLLIASTVGFVNLLKNGVWQGWLTPNQAAATGFGVGLAGINYKKLSRAFKTVYISPQDVRDSLLIFYVKETAKEKVRAVSKAIGSTLKLNAPRP